MVSLDDSPRHNRSKEQFRIAEVAFSRTKGPQEMVPVMARIERAILWLDRPASAWVLVAALAPLFLLMLAPTDWNSNEENYLQLAYSKVAPEKFTTYHAIFDDSRARIVSETLLGTAVKWFGYSSAHIALRLILALLYATGLALLFSGLAASVLESFLIIAVFCVMGEEMIAAESLFRGIEPKALAYSMVFVAFGFACRRRWSAAIAFAALSTSMHFLVGGFWTGMLLLLEWVQEKQVKRVAWHAALFAILIAPLMIVVVPHDIVSLLPASGSGLTPDTIYSEIRGSEHVAPFKALYTFWGWVPGIVVILSLIGVLAGLHHRRLLTSFAVVPMVGLHYLVFALIIAYFDRHTNYLGKFYLFRPNSLILFFAITAIVLSIRRHCSNDGRWIFAVLSAAFVFVYVSNTMKTQIDRVRRAPAIPFEQELVDAIERNSAPQDIVLLEPFKEMDAEYQRLHRLIPRPTLVSWKFAPFDPANLIRWYDLIQRRERLFAHGCVEPMDPPVRLLVVFQRDVAERMLNCGDPVWRHGDVTVIKVREVARVPEVTSVPR